MRDGNRDMESMIEEVKTEAKRRISELSENGLRTSKEAAKKLDAYSYEKPWIVVAIFSTIAVVVGFILGRKSKS